MKKAIALVTFLALAGFSNAATVAGTNLVGFDATTNPITDSAGALIPGSGPNIGSVGIGAFSITDTQIQEATSVGDILAAFTSVSSGQFGAGFSGNGLYQLAAGNAPAVTSGSVYTVIGNAPSLAASSELLIVKHTASFAADPAITPDAILSASGSGNISSVVVGGFQNFQGDFGAGPVDAYNTVVIVPEPAAAALGLLGFLGLLRRRR